jgi:hypothetical protein
VKAGLPALAVCLAVALVGAACSDGTNARVPSASKPTQPPARPMAPGAAPVSTVGPASNAPSVPSQPQAQIGQELAKFVLDQRSAVRAGQSLGEWKKLHDRDYVELYAPNLAEQTNENWCARATSAVPVDAQRTWIHTAYFYLPPQPDPPVLPAASESSALIDRCTLGFVWAEVDSPDPAHADVLSDVVTQAISAVLGPVEPNAKLFWWGSGSWRRKGRWEDDGTAVATAITEHRAWGNRDETTPHNRLLVIAAGGISGIDLRFPQSGGPAIATTACHERQRLAISRIEEALSIAGQVGGSEEDVRSSHAIVAARDGCSEVPTTSDRAAIFNAVVRWLDAARTLPPARQAAALFVADQLVERSGGPTWRRGEHPVVRRSLEKLGAQFDWSPLGAAYFYTHPWLRRAFQLAPDDRAGELAFLTLMERGFETSGMCRDQHGEGFRAVIAEGNRYLRQKPGSALRGDIHFMMAQAYGDIVTLAAGGGYDGSESAKYQAEAVSARTHALAHFEAAYKSSGRSARARDVWPDAWRLLAGLAPRQTRFYCVYD